MYPKKKNMATTQTELDTLLQLINMQPLELTQKLLTQMLNKLSELELEVSKEYDMFCRNTAMMAYFHKVVSALQNEDVQMDIDVDY